MLISEIRSKIEYYLKDYFQIVSVYVNFGFNMVMCINYCDKSQNDEKSLKYTTWRQTYSIFRVGTIISSIFYMNQMC